MTEQHDLVLESGACSRGHAWTAENVYMFRGQRNCRACNRERVREYKARRVAAGLSLAPLNSKPKAKTLRLCDACGADFIAKMSHQRFCRKKCYSQDVRRRHKTGAHINDCRDMPGLKERLIAKSARNAATGCLEWTASRTSQGYGILGVKTGFIEGAHRAAYAVFKGPIPKGMMVRHKCDNPPCVDPEHLELGTALDNSNDRLQRAERLGKLSKTEVQTIRRLLNSGKDISEIAVQFGVAPSTIRNIQKGVSWSHLPAPPVMKVQL